MAAALQTPSQQSRGHFYYSVHLQKTCQTTSLFPPLFFYRLSSSRFELNVAFGSFKLMSSFFWEKKPKRKLGTAELTDDRSTNSPASARLRYPCCRNKCCKGATLFQTLLYSLVLGATPCLENKYRGSNNSDLQQFFSLMMQYVI